MKKIISILLFCIAFCFSADVKPLYFNNVSNDSVEQQAEWDYLMKYKMFGAHGIEFAGQNINVPDKSGWFGTADGDWSLANTDHKVGGPIIIGGSISFDNGNDSLTTGPVNVGGNIIIKQEGFKDRTNAFLSYQCVKGTVDQKYYKYGHIADEYQFFGDNYSNCPADVPQIKTTLEIPELKKDTTYSAALSAAGNNLIYIDVPPDTTMYDLYIEKISLYADAKLVVRMPFGGRLTRIFLKEGFFFENHGRVQVMYMSEDAKFEDGKWSGDGIALANRDYSGNLLFYTGDVGFSWAARTQTDSLQGTYITTGKISIQQQMTLAGQLLSNNLFINANFDGSGFLYVPFDPPELNIDPTALASGKFVENNIDTKIPIQLDTLSKTNVYFKYCFIVKDSIGNASIDDFNKEIPICGESEKTVTILEGTKYPTEDLYLNVKADGIKEGEEVLKMKIYDLQGAVMPGNLHQGYFSLYLIDVDIYEINTDGLAKDIPENKKDTIIGKVTIDGGDTTTRFSITNPKYVIDSITGVITLIEEYDYEVKQKDTIRIIAHDSTKADTVDYVINILDVNENPIIKDQAFSIPENYGTKDSVGIVIVSDIDNSKEFTNNKIVLADTTNFRVKDNKIYTKKSFDYESKDTIQTIKIYAIDVNDNRLKDSATISLKINDVNEPHKVSDETITIPEDTTKTFKSYPIDTVKVTDPDLNPKHKFELIDTTNTFKIDPNGVITVIKPLDYESVKEYNVKVIVSDSLYTDTATIKIKVDNIDEKSNVQIVHVDTRDSVYTETDKPIYTNDKDIEITYKTDNTHKDTTITGLKEGENKIEICDVGIGKDTKDCDTVTVWYSNKTPIITVTTINKNKTNVNNITIIDEPDGNQYVNNKNPEIKVTVKDPTNAKKDTTFNINVDLKTVDVPVKSLTNKTIEPIDIALTPDAKHEVIGKDSVKVTYYDSIAKATVSYVTNSEGKRIDDEFTVSWVEKVNGQDVTISYTADSYVEVKSNYSISYSVPQGKDTITVSYQVDSDGKIQKTNGNVGYTISYSYTNAYGNTGTSEIQVVLDDIPPKVEIYKLIAGKDTLYPGEAKNWAEYVKSSSITVFWAVDSKDQDTLTLQGLKAEKINPIVRCYQDKANNQTCDTVMVYAKCAKEIEIKIAHPVTEINQDKVDSFYHDGGKYNPKKPIQIIAQDASEDKLPEPVGVGIKIGLALPILNQNGGMPTADDIVQTIDGVTGIVIDGNGNVVTDAIAEIRDNSTKVISVDNYIENYCTDSYKAEVRKNGIEKVLFYDMKYSMHVWIFNNNAEYVNDFNFEYTIDENQKADASGMLNLMVDWLAAKDGYVKAKNNKNLGTGAYIGKISAVSVAKAKCTLNSDTQKGTKIKKDETEMFTFGYKRPVTK